jgi:hypothetical protein
MALKPRKPDFWFCRLITFAVCIGLPPGVTEAVAQEWPRAANHRPARRLTLRGQEPEFDEADEDSPFDDHLETDRDSFTPSTRTVSVDRWIVESAYSFVDNRNAKETHSFPEVLLRYGLTERLELRFGANYEVGGEGANVSGNSGGSDFESAGELVHESQLLYGAKLRLSEQVGWSPESSFIAQAHTPTSGPDPATALSLGYVFGWEFPNEWKLDSAIRFGADKEGDDRFEAWATSVVLRKSIAERWNVHVEYFGRFTQNRADNVASHFFSPGLHYLVTPNFEIGTRVGWGLNDDTPHFFNNTGFGLRF